MVLKSTQGQTKLRLKAALLGTLPSPTPPPPLLSFTGFYYNPPSKGQHGPVNMGQHSDGCGPSACVFPTPLKYPFESHTLC